MMDNITIVKIKDDQHILAIYNPDDIRKYDITASKLNKQIAMFSAIGIDKIFIGNLMQNFIIPYFEQNTKSQYTDYKPVFVNFKQLPDDMILLIVQFCKASINCDKNCKQCQYNSKEIIESSAEQYIKEYLTETNINIDEFQNICVLKTDSIDNVLKACTILPIAKCIKSDIIKYRNSYYLSFKYYEKDLKDIRYNILTLSEFGELKDPIMYSHLVEHGKLISGRLLDICGNNLVK